MLDKHGSYPEEKEREKEYTGGEKKREGRQTDREPKRERETTQRKTENRECVCMCTCVLGTYTEKVRQT